MSQQILRSASSLNRRQFGAGMLGLAAAAGFSVKPAIARAAQSATPVASPVAGGAPMLAVADPDASVLYVIDTDTLAVTGIVEDVVMQTHCGFLPTPDGLLYLVDDVGSRLIAIDSTAQIVGEAAFEGYPSHIATDPDLRFMAIGTDNADAPIVIVDLSTWEARPVPLTEAGEVGLALTSNPNVLLHRNDVSNQVESYQLEEALAGNVTPASTVQIGAFGDGEAYDPATGRFYIATDDGVDVVSLDGAELEFVSTVPWETADRSGGRAYFHRLNADGTALVTYLANREAPEAEWGTWENDLFMVDANTLESTRTPLGNGYLLRYTLSHETALFTVVHFDGDVTHSVDLANGDVVGEVSLDPMTNAPVDGAAPWEAENRTTAITPDGSLGFVTQGGDGIIVVIDVESQAIHSTITVDTVLGYGGYLGVFGTADIVFDLIGR
ncbi:MAG: hypothetical protein M3451_07615 [Chloroflexota bacterium]|nr:hypothetical protein [Chloroflexota bacterium]